ncbi:MAG: uracil-DNA glycosylase [Sphingobium sp. 32-64-5]|nr:MAG: uracil-DNA glycosylase [Sphingobium sp. 32-64-5]
MQDILARLLEDIRACRHCAGDLPHGPRPVVQAGRTARLRIIGQAPGRKVHETGIPWNDASGDRLRAWLGLTPARFYDPRRVAIIPMGFCYPGKAGSGDKPPRAECAPRWHEALNAQLPGIALTLLIGQYAQARYLGRQRLSTLGETVRAWRDYLPQGYIPLPHPSPRNQPWLAKNPWFEAELLPGIRAAISASGLDVEPERGPG